MAGVQGANFGEGQHGGIYKMRPLWSGSCAAGGSSEKLIQMPKESWVHCDS